MYLPEGCGDLVTKVDVARSVEEVDEEGLALDVGLHQRHRHRLDRHPSLLLSEQGVCVPEKVTT